jgi:hypothetical protein
MIIDLNLQNDIIRLRIIPRQRMNIKNMPRCTFQIHNQLIVLKYKMLPET